MKNPKHSPSRIISPAEEEAMRRHEPFDPYIPDNTPTPKIYNCQNGDHEDIILHDDANGCNYLRCRICGREVHY
jgi:hypothetical protein